MPLFFKRIILLAEQLLYALAKRQRGRKAPVMLNNSLIPARTEEIASASFSQTFCSVIGTWTLIAAKAILNNRKRILSSRSGGRRTVLSGIRLCQVADVDATVPGCRETALEKRLAGDHLLQKHMRGSSIGPVLFKDRTAVLERIAHGN